MITITFRDINGKRQEISQQTPSLMYHALYEAIEKEIITDEDEILLVVQDNMCLYSALCVIQPITIDDLLGFFG